MSNNKAHSLFFGNRALQFWHTFCPLLYFIFSPPLTHQQECRNPVKQKQFYKEGCKDYPKCGMHLDKHQNSVPRNFTRPGKEANAKANQYFHANRKQIFMTRAKRPNKPSAQTIKKKPCSMTVLFPAGNEMLVLDTPVVFIL